MRMAVQSGRVCPSPERLRDMVRPERAVSGETALCGGVLSYLRSGFLHHGLRGSSFCGSLCSGTTINLAGSHWEYSGDPAMGSARVVCFDAVVRLGMSCCSIRKSIPEGFA